MERKDLAVFVCRCRVDLLDIVGTAEDNVAAAYLNTVNPKLNTCGNIVGGRSSCPFHCPIFVGVGSRIKLKAPSNVNVTVEDTINIIKGSCTHNVAVSIKNFDNKALPCIAPNFAPNSIGTNVTVEVVAHGRKNNRACNRAARCVVNSSIKRNRCCFSNSQILVVTKLDRSLAHIRDGNLRATVNHKRTVLCSNTSARTTGDSHLRIRDSNPRTVDTVLDSIGNRENRILDNRSSMNNTVYLATSYRCIHNVNRCRSFTCVNDITCGILVIGDIQLGIDKLKICTRLKMEYCVSLNALFGRRNLHTVYNEGLTFIYKEVTVANVNVILTENNITVFDSNVIVVRIFNVNVKRLAIKVDGGAIDSRNLCINGDISRKFDFATVSKRRHELVVCSNLNEFFNKRTVFGLYKLISNFICIGNTTLCRINSPRRNCICCSDDRNRFALGNNDNTFEGRTFKVKFLGKDGNRTCRIGFECIINVFVIHTVCIYGAVVEVVIAVVI